MAQFFMGHLGRFFSNRDQCGSWDDNINRFENIFFFFSLSFVRLLDNFFQQITEQFVPGLGSMWYLVPMMKSSSGLNVLPSISIQFPADSGCSFTTGRFFSNQDQSDNWFQVFSTIDRADCSSFRIIVMVPIVKISSVAVLILIPFPANGAVFHEAFGQIFLQSGSVWFLRLQH